MKERPVYLDLRKIRLPVTAITSILHRATGTALVLGLPFLLWLLAASLNWHQSFHWYEMVLHAKLMKIILILFLWSFFHYALFDIRLFLLDMHWGLSLPKARLTAKIILYSSPFLAVILGGYLLW